MADTTRKSSESASEPEHNGEPQADQPKSTSSKSEALSFAKAVEFLDVTPLRLVKLIRKGELTYHVVGKRKMIPLEDLERCRERMYQEAKKGLEEMTRISIEEGFYDDVFPPKSED